MTFMGGTLSRQQTQNHLQRLSISKEVDSENWWMVCQKSTMKPIGFIWTIIGIVIEYTIALSKTASSLFYLLVIGKKNAFYCFLCDVEVNYYILLYLFIFTLLGALIGLIIGKVKGRK